MFLKAGRVPALLLALSSMCVVKSLQLEKSKSNLNGAGIAHIYPLKYKMADELREFLGDDAVADALRIPAWRGNIVADREKMACRAERRRA